MENLDAGQEFYFGELPEEISPKGIYNTNVYFSNTYKDNWIRKPLSIEMIKDIDKSDVIDNASTCGDNCAAWILKIAENQKIVINLMKGSGAGKSQMKRTPDFNI